MTVAGVRVSDLVEQYGTPLYVLDEQHVRDQAVRVREAFEREAEKARTSVRVYYAGKAFLSTEMVRWVTESGLLVDVASGGELAVALAAGVDPKLIGVHGNNKSVAEIERAVRAGVGTIVVDAPIEIARVAAVASAAGVVQRVRLRVNSGVHAHTHDFLATAHEDQKFGITIEDAPAVVALIRAQSSLAFVGLHCHIGSQIFGTEAFAESASRLLELHAKLSKDGDVPELNLGGGFGIAYTPADKPASIDDIAAGLVGAVAAECRRLRIPLPVIAVEPGRIIVGTAGLTLYRVGVTKDVRVDLDPEVAGKRGPTSAVRRYVSVDGGMSDNARPALYGADYSVRIANRISNADPVLVRIAGKHCESGDILIRADYLPGDVTVGDILAVPATGAYCFSLSSNYNYLARPAVVAVREWRSRVIVRGETEQDLLSRDAGIAKTEDFL
jgi:diaminopimelate decarboxylase